MRKITVFMIMMVLCMSFASAQMFKAPLHKQAPLSGPMEDDLAADVNGPLDGIQEPHEEDLTGDAIKATPSKKALFAVDDKEEETVIDMPDKEADKYFVAYPEAKEEEKQIQPPSQKKERMMAKTLPPQEEDKPFQEEDKPFAKQEAEIMKKAPPQSSDKEEMMKDGVQETTDKKMPMMKPQGQQMQEQQYFEVSNDVVEERFGAVDSDEVGAQCKQMVDAAAYRMQELEAYIMDLEDTVETSGLTLPAKPEDMKSVQALMDEMEPMENAKGVEIPGEGFFSRIVGFFTASRAQVNADSVDDVNVDGIKRTASVDGVGNTDVTRFDTLSDDDGQADDGLGGDSGIDMGLQVKCGNEFKECEAWADQKYNACKKKSDSKKEACEDKNSGSTDAVKECMKQHMGRMDACNDDYDSRWNWCQDQHNDCMNQGSS